MRNWQLTGLVVGAAALLFTARPAQAQVWVSPPVVAPARPVWVSRPVVAAASPVWVSPPVVAAPPVWAARPAPVVVARPSVVVSPGWGARPRDVRRAYRAARRAGW
jgi:hypothetical protein